MKVKCKYRTNIQMEDTDGEQGHCKFIDEFLYGDTGGTAGVAWKLCVGCQKCGKPDGDNTYLNDFKEDMISTVLNTIHRGHDKEMIKIGMVTKERTYKLAFEGMAKLNKDVLYKRQRLFWLSEHGLIDVQEFEDISSEFDLGGDIGDSESAIREFAEKETT